MVGKTVLYLSGLWLFAKRPFRSGGSWFTRGDLAGVQISSEVPDHARNELGHTQALFPGGLRDEDIFLLGGQDPNPEHEPPPKFGP